MLTSLHPGASYRRVRLVRLVGMMLIVLVQDRHAAYVRNVAAECVGTGIMGKMVSGLCLECESVQARVRTPRC